MSEASAVQPCSPAEIPSHWVEIELHDDSGFLVPYEEYLLTLPNGEIVAGYLDENGFARIETDTPGNCEITFPNLDARSWKYERSDGPRPL
ncbi:MAG: hypothetical protein H7039_12475 [Bryobacteraceae bacterium]|nr:hypothetical protein [Bryobacteraceae bacterium]